jgi:hypothetical protein
MSGAEPAPEPAADPDGPADLPAWLSPAALVAAAAVVPLLAAAFPLVPWRIATHGTSWVLLATALAYLLWAAPWMGPDLPRRRRIAVRVALLGGLLFGADLLALRIAAGKSDALRKEAGLVLDALEARFRPLKSYPVDEAALEAAGFRLPPGFDYFGRSDGKHWFVRARDPGSLPYQAASWERGAGGKEWSLIGDSRHFRHR